MPCQRWLVAAFTPLRALWPHRLLRLVHIPAREPPCRRHGAPGHPELRARRGMVLELLDAAVPRRPQADRTPAPPARPARAWPSGTRAAGLAETPALTRRRSASSVKPARLPFG